MTNESARHIVRAWMIFNGYQSLFCALWLKFSFRKFLQLKKERKWWRGRFTVQWQQRKKKFCPELDKRLSLVGIRWGENAMPRKPCCSRTTESDSSSVFVTGSTNFKIESIWSHEKSNGHNRAVAAIEVAENPRLTPLPRVLWTVSPDVAQKMERLFDIAYFIAKREMPFTSFHIFAIIHLEMKHGVDLRKYIHKWQLKNELLCKRQKCRFVSVMADSATDVGVREIEDVFVSTERSTGTLHRVW